MEQLEQYLIGKTIKSVMFRQSKGMASLNFTNGDDVDITIITACGRARLKVEVTEADDLPYLEVVSTPAQTEETVFCQVYHHE